MIGIIGGYGNIGLQAADILQKWGKEPLRIGGRNPEHAPAFAKEKFKDAQWMSVDIYDEQSIEKFMEGCDLIVNCSGPSYLTSSRICKLALANSIHCVDAGFDSKLVEMEKDYENADCSVIYGAGSSPGLSGLLPRYIASHFEKTEHLTYFHGGLSEFTHSAAEDYLEGVLNPEENTTAVWVNGEKKNPDFMNRDEQILPFFPRPVETLPFFDLECEAVAQELQLESGQWNMAVDGKYIQACMKKVRQTFLKDKEAAIADLCRSADLDAKGRVPYMMFLVEMRGKVNQAEKSETLVLRVDHPSILTGSMTGAVAIAVMNGETKKGLHPMAKAADSVKMVEWLQKQDFIGFFQVFQGTLDTLLVTEEGEL